MAALRSGIVTVTTAGTAVAGPSLPIGDEFVIKAHPDNLTTIWIGNDGADDVSSSNGFPLDAGESLNIGDIESLDRLRFDAETDGDKACWYKVR